MKASEHAERSRELPDLFADRLTPRDLQIVREHASGGAWDEEIDVLLAALHAGGSSITIAERDEIAALLDHMHMPHDRLDVVRVSD